MRQQTTDNRSTILRSCGLHFNKMDFRSIRFKLTLWYAGVLGAVLVVFSVVVYLSLAEELYELVEEESYDFVEDELEEAESEVREELHELLTVLMVAVPGSLVLAAWGGWFLAKKALKPVDNITQAAQSITARNLSERLETTGVKDEIGRLSETLNGMIARLEKSFEQMRQFTADASHELRTPLTAMRGEIEVALRSKRPIVEYERVLASCLEEVGRMSRIVEDLLTLSRSDSGELKLTMAQVRLDQLLAELYEHIKPWAEERGLDFALEDANWPGQLNPMEEVAVMGDEFRLRQLFLNLVANAVKYTPGGGRISLSMKKRDNRVEVVVEDTGIGISHEDLPHIFDRFYRVDKARSREMGGSGLGLSICQWIASAHGGEMHVHSKLGQGSTFTVSLPMSVAGENRLQVGKPRRLGNSNDSLTFL